MPHTLHDVQAHHWFALAEVRTLFQAYADELGVDLCLQGFAEEVAGLPGKYSAPGGGLFLLRVGNVPAGCVALREMGPGVCELKRLYVTPDFRGTGLGNWLLDAAIERARTLGYSALRLDTLARMETAGKMYRRRGFVVCSPHNTIEEPDIEFFELDLQAAVKNPFG